MHDLRYDPAEAPASGTPTAVTVPAQHLDPSDLRTVPMPDLRSAEARLLDAAARGIEGEDGEPRDTRTFPEMVTAQLVRLVDLIQAWRLELDEFKEFAVANQDATEVRLSRLEDSFKRLADAVQIMALEKDRK